MDEFLINSVSSGVDTITDFNQLDGRSDQFDMLRFQGFGVGVFAYLGVGTVNGGSDNSAAHILGNHILVDTNVDATANIILTMTGMTNARQIGADGSQFV